jgi:cysteine-S-conjugate beta-lyase
MKNDFDEIIERHGTDSVKYDLAVRRGKKEDILPLWVADMDFRSPACVIEALKARADHGIFGYSTTGDKYFSAVAAWFKGSTGWEIKRNWLVQTPGVIAGVAAAIRALTEKGEGVLIQEPVYYPFADSIKSNGRKKIVNELVYHDGRYTIDLKDFEQKIIENNVKLFILCSPHNPVGRVWTPEELISMGDICLRNGVIVAADEIHQDFIYSGHTHVVFADIKTEFAEISVTCTAPSKTFNLAGLQISNIVIPNREIRKRFKEALNQVGYNEANIMGLVACEAAYEGGREWLSELKEYLDANLKFLREFLQKRIPKVRLVEPEGTYLVWLDFRGTELDDEALEELITEKAGLWLDAGTMFGAGGSGFERINIACPKATLEEALLRLENAVNEME